MKKSVVNIVPGGYQGMWNDNRSFFDKETNKRWEKR
jgi:hypothetical protein|tara:strand:+ start:171 stop:278 length:108 start_codon:yes stop_codon:yes gene_type:complete